MSGERRKTRGTTSYSVWHAAFRVPAVTCRAQYDLDTHLSEGNVYLGEGSPPQLQVQASKTDPFSWEDRGQFVSSQCRGGSRERLLRRTAVEEDQGGRVRRGDRTS